MMRAAAVALLFSAACSSPVEVEELAFAADDACGADPQGEQCILSLRQLRAVKKHDAEGDNINGFCCHSAADDNTCATCFSTAKAAAGTFCATSGTCGGEGGCGGTWCEAVCVYSAQDPDDFCGTAFETAIATNSDFCGKSEKNCGGCGGTWCAKAAIAAFAKKGAASSGVALRQAAAAQPERKPVPVAPDNGFCCHSSSDSSDACGSCYPTAKAEVGTYCAEESGCGGCGGTWCEQVCVTSSEDPADPCTTGYASAVSAPTEFCSQSTKNCEGSCSGHWCAKHTIKAFSTKKALAQANATRVAAKAEKQAAPAVAADPGFCCHSGSDPKNTCGTCYSTAMALESSFCGTSADQCGTCGGSWCSAQCVFSGEDPKDVCGTAYSTAVAAADSYCGKSSKSCSGCGGTWCFKGTGKATSE